MDLLRSLTGFLGHGTTAATSPAAAFRSLSYLSGNAPALHATVDLPQPVPAIVDFYVNQRDKPLLSGRSIAPSAQTAHRRALKNFCIYSYPGWGNFTFGAKSLHYAHDAAGHGLTHVSVSGDGAVTRRGDVTLVGSPKMALAADWVTEFRTVAFRTIYALRLKERDTGKLPERELLMGHSKGGLLVYLMACVTKSYKADKAAGVLNSDGTLSTPRLDRLIANLKDAEGRTVLGDFPKDQIVFLVEALSDAVFGTIGSPLFGIQGDFEKFTDWPLSGLNFNKMFGDSAKFYTPQYMRAVHEMTGYEPNEVLDFVVTSKLEPLDLYSPLQTMKRGLSTLSGLARAPIVNGGNLLFKGLSRFIAPSLDHDGIAPSDYPVPFAHHLHIPGATHIDQVEDEAIMGQIFDFLAREHLIG